MPRLSPRRNSAIAWREARHQARPHPGAMGEQPRQAAPEGHDARWTVKYTKAKPSEEGGPRLDLAVPAFGYKNYIGIDQRHGLIRRWVVTDAARYDGALLPDLIDRNNTDRK